LTVSGAKDCPCVKAPTPESTAAKKARRACSRGDEGRRLVLQGLAAAPAVLGQGALGLGDAGQHLAQIPAEASLHDLLHDPPEVGRRLVVVLARAGDVRAAHQVPVDQSADVDRDVARALLELGRDLLEREGLRLEGRGARRFAPGVGSGRPRSRPPLRCLRRRSRSRGPC